MKYEIVFKIGAIFASLLGASPAFAQAPAPAAPAAPAAPRNPIEAGTDVPPVVPPQAGPATVVERVPELDLIPVEPGGLTADETARRALAASPPVGQKRAELVAANARIRQTMTEFFPQLVLRASYTRLSPVEVAFGQGASVGAQNAGLLTIGNCPPGTGAPGTQCVLDSRNQPVGAAEFAFEYPVNNYGLVASLSIPLSDYALRLSHAAASSSASRDASRYALEAEKLRVLTDARVLYYNWLRAHGQVAIAQKSLERTRARLQDARTAFEVGTSSKADLLRLEAMVANTELAVQQAIALRALTNAQLAIIMEDRQAPPLYKVGQGLVLPKTGSVAESETRRLVQRALERRLELKALDASTRAYRRGAKATRAGMYPRLDVVGDVTYANPNQRFFPLQQEWNASWSVGAAATWNLAQVFGSDARADELDANVLSNLSQRRHLEGAIANEVVTAQLDIYKAQAGVRTNATALKAAEEAYRVTTELYRAGQATTTDLIESEAELLTAKLGEVNANIDLVIAATRLRHVTGAEVELTRAEGPLPPKN